MLKKTKNVISIIFLPLLLSGWISTAIAEESSPKNPDKFKMVLGAFKITNSETTLRIDSVDVPAGVYINLERQLGVKTNEVEGRIEGYYRFNSKHRFDYGYYPIGRSGTVAINIEIPTDPPISAGTVVTTTFDTTTYKLGYTYSFYNSEEVELGLSAGFHITSFKLALLASGGSSAASNKSDVTAPLPVVGVLLNYNITPNWLVSYNSQAFFLQVQGNKGTLTDTSLAIEYRGFDNVAFGLSANRVSLDVDFKDESYLGTVNNEIEGFTAYMALYF